MRVTTFTRAMLHDPTVYPNPEEFVPGRFLKDGRLNPDVRDPTRIAFGFGRRLVQTVPSILGVRLICFLHRICPGRYFADATVFTFIASVLHTLNITPPIDEFGQPIHITPQASNGLVS